MKKLSLCGFKVLLGLSSLLVTGIAQTRTPVVLFPGWHCNKLQVTVTPAVARECPEASGTFENWLFCDQLSSISQVCQDKLMTLAYKRQPFIPMSQRFSDQPGVTVTIKDYGKTQSAPFYEGLYAFLQLNGYTRNLNIRVAGYDARLTPDIGDFLQRTVKLIEQTYADNGNTPVHLVGHSNGPLYAQYLLTQTSQAWKNKYIHGFTSLAGNWPGQGWLYTPLFTGLNVNDASYPADTANATSSALMYQSHPSTYMSAADPAVFKDAEVVIQAGYTIYTPQHYRKLFRDAGMALAEELGPYYIGFVRFQQPPFFPNVDVYAEIGSGLETVVGVGLPNLSVGQVVDFSTQQWFTRLGDSNQEDITNESIRVWDKMKCFRFDFTNTLGLGHMDLPSNGGVLGRLLTNLQRPRSVCR